MKKTILTLAAVFYFSISVFAQNTEGGIKGVDSQEKKQENLPQLPAEWLQRLWDSCTLVDYTYLSMPITMALDRQQSIRSSLRHIGSGQVARQADCKLFAKLFFQIKGRIVLDADLYFSGNGCSYFVYNVAGKPVYANPVSTEGVQFLNQIIERQKAKKN